MARWESGSSDRDRLADQLAGSSRPTTSESTYRYDHSETWWFIPIALLLGLGLCAGGVALLVNVPGFRAQAAGVCVLAWGASFLSQYGVLAWYALQVPRLRRARIEAALAKAPTPALTDLDVKQFHVPMRRTYYAAPRFGLIDPGDGPTPLLMAITQMVGIGAICVLFGSAILAAVALATSGL